MWWPICFAGGAVLLALSALLDVIAEWAAEARDWLEWTAYECAQRIGEW